MELFKLLGELSQRHRYAGTKNEEWACRLLADRLKEIGCEVELEDTTYIKTEIYPLLMGMGSMLLLLGFIVASGWVHSLIVGLGIIGFMAFMAILYPRIELKLAKAKSTNIIGKINPQQEQRLLLTAHYDSAKNLPKYIQRFYNVFRWIGSLFNLLMLLFIGLLLSRGLWMLIVSGEISSLTHIPGAGAGPCRVALVPDMVVLHGDHGRYGLLRRRGDGPPFAGRILQGGRRQCLRNGGPVGGRQTIGQGGFSGRDRPLPLCRRGAGAVRQPGVGQQTCEGTG
ncbi:hypothetical protein LM599_03025 [Candidatus Acetothermia bacterium]|nr:hypothetical protein [Candidatus Acetothermia bacterium]